MVGKDLAGESVVTSQTDIRNMFSQYDQSSYGVYAVDVSTNEIVYANPVICEYMDLTDLRQIVGRKCYEVLHLNSRPCASCSRHKLNHDAFYEWEYYNPLRYKSFFIKNKLVDVGERTYQLGILQELEKSEGGNTFSDYEKSSSLVNEMFRVALYKENPDQAISVILEYLGQSLVADRAHINEYEEEGVFSNTYEWCRLGVESLQADRQRIHMDQSLKVTTYARPAFITDIEMIKDFEPNAYQYFHAIGVHSLITYPLWKNQSISGWISFENPDPDKIPVAASVLQTVVNFLESLIINRELFRRLEESANVDSLTGLSNRHALDRILDEIDPGHSIGILFCDVCGLKRRNDKGGHDAGDEMLCAAADVLRECFPDAWIIRYGGDEFLVLAENMSEDTFLQAQEYARQRSAAQNAPLAIGSVWRMDATSDIHSLIHSADQKMYLDKEQYYSHQNNRRRISDKLNEDNLLESAPVPVLIYDKDNHIIRSNQKTWQLFGCGSESEFMAFSDGRFLNLVAPEDREHLDTVMRYAKANHVQRFHVIRYRVVKRTGERVQIEDRGELMTYADGSEYVNCIFIDLVDSSWHSGVELDSLTGLITRRQFYLSGAEIVDQAKTKGTLSRYYVVYTNIHHFKEYNLQYGREAGDRLLRYWSEQLLKGGNSEVLNARFGNDHFVTLSSRDPDYEMVSVARDKFESRYGKYGMHMKVGIYPFDQAHTQITIEQACDMAKTACDAIRDRPDFLQLYDREFRKKIVRERYIVSHFEEAISQKQIKAYFQPIVRTISGAVCCLEALARWDDPALGMLSPGEFVPILEKNHLITALDLYILREACEALSSRIRSDCHTVPISVNLSREDFYTCDIVGEAEKILSDCHVPQDQIRIEITETIVMSDKNFMRREIERFHDAGYEVWMDDFGSDYSSLNMLNEFDFDKIKLDKEFLSHIDEKSKKIISSTLSMAKELGITTLAEGVETAEQYRMLQNMGCGMVQGFYFSRPIPNEEMEKLMRSPEGEEEYGEFTFTANDYDVRMQTKRTYEGNGHQVYQNHLMVERSPSEHR